MFNYKMHDKNTLPEYSLISKLLHWASAILLFVQVPLGFYLVDLDFGPERINIENIHVLVGLSMFYLVILRLINKIINPPPKLEPSIFKGQKFLAKTNHLLLYVTILLITISGILKKFVALKSLLKYLKASIFFVDSLSIEHSSSFSTISFGLNLITLSIKI